MGFAVVLSVILLIFLNGATDASNAIATAVTSGAIRMRHAAILAAVCNAIGGILSGILFSGIGTSVLSAVNFGAHGKIGVLASLAAAVIFTFLAWIARLPTSESHALLAASAGASLALGNTTNIWMAFLPSLLWMSMCVICGFLFGAILPRILPQKRLKSHTRALLIVSAAASSVLHGTQDLAKFIAMLAASGISGAAQHPVLLCSAAAIMGLGALCGGSRMTEAVGRNLAQLDRHAALSADLGCAVVLAILSFLGIPASTTHTKTAATAGSAVSAQGCFLRTRPFLRFISAWILTFPVCAGLGHLLAQVLLRIVG